MDGIVPNDRLVHEPALRVHGTSGAPRRRNKQTVARCSLTAFAVAGVLMFGSPVARAQRWRLQTAIEVDRGTLLRENSGWPEH